MLGQKYGRLTVESKAPRNSYGKAMWNVVCECGTHKAVQQAKLRAGTTVSCGCLRTKKVVERSLKHGGKHTPEYPIFRAMTQRCGNPNHKSYRYYGGRGITVRYEGFAAFLADVGPRPSPKHTIDRINNNGNYEPGNCRWATWSQQRLNSRSRAEMDRENDR